ncbi:diguanylate cyclase [Arcobacter sp. 15-2]|uniref:sensor domain-containing diguanylate cyclase n=1 Tax=Arcobacter sp. 15-2 TaxID=3374109 RepID=UPI00399CB6F1
MQKISIKITVISLFIFLSSLIMLMMFYIQYIFSQELITQSVNDKVKLLSAKVENHIKYINDLHENTIQNGSNFLEETSIEDFIKNKNTYIRQFTKILNNNKNIYSVYVGFKGDHFFELINLDIDKKLRTQYQASKDAKWLYIEIVNDKQQFLLLDGSLKTLSKKTEKTSYYSTTRPWYKEAIQTGKVIKTKPYIFSNIKAKGVTYAKKINNTQNVFALDFLLNNINGILKEYEAGILENSFIFDKNGTVIASSNSTKQSEILGEIKRFISANPNKNTVMKNILIDNKKYIISIVPLGKEFLCTTSEISKLTIDYKSKMNNMMIIVVLILLTIVPLIFYFSSIIVKPILSLMKESIKVKNRNFDKVKLVDTNVLEIHLLSTSLLNMSTSIDEYQTNLETKVKERTLELYKINEELKLLSVTDKLTGLYNRMKLDVVIEEEVNRANRYDQKFGLIIIDIDFFKSVNDTYGHQVGDTVLVEFASILKESVRKTDIVGRWGGEEFIVISIESSLESTLKLANKIRENIEQFQFSIVKHKTASFGVSSYKRNEKIEETINRADKALYLAKESGRNQVMSLEKK